jgi:molecular chaperone DnaJ
VHVDLDVPSHVAATGGSVTAVYYRMQRADSWRPGMGDPGLVRVQDIADVRVIPGTRTGEVVREKGLGNAGPHGGPYGDLVVRIKVNASRQAPPPPPEPPPSASSPGSSSESATDTDRHEVTLDITVVEALLGGRVPLQTSQGSVRLSIPPGSSGGTRLRLKGKGPVGADGQSSDLYVTLRIVVPSNLDAESRRHIEAFARLNPDLSR